MGRPLCLVCTIHRPAVILGAGLVRDRHLIQHSCQDTLKLFAYSFSSKW